MSAPTAFFSLFLCDFSSLSQFSYLQWQRARSGQALPAARSGPAMTHLLNPVSGWHIAKWPRSSGSDVSAAALVALPETDGSCEAANCSILGQDLLWLHFWHGLGKCCQMLKYTWKKLGGILDHRNVKSRFSQIHLQKQKSESFLAGWNVTGPVAK